MPNDPDDQAADDQAPEDQTPENQTGLIDAYWFDGTGSAISLSWDDIDTLPRPAGFSWIHLQRDAPEAREYLLERSGLPEIASMALLAADSRPRTTAFDEGLIVNVRGVNMNPGANAEDMVSLRLWCEGARVISVRQRKLMAVDDLRDAIRRGRGPKTPAELATILADGLTTRIGEVVMELEEQVDELEEQVVEAQSQELRLALSAVRRKAIGLRRFIGPNREAIQRLVNDPAEWLDPLDRMRLREVADKITRYVEELDSARERAAVVQDEIASRLAERLNKNTYVLSVIAAIFLPLSLLTGLLGINVGGMPGEKMAGAFWVVSAGILVLGVLEYWLLKKLKWI